jgi:hypothetical protein
MGHGRIDETKDLERETGLEPAASTLARRLKLWKSKDNQGVLDGAILEVTAPTVAGFINFQSTSKRVHHRREQDI